MTSTGASAALPGQGSRLPPTFRALRHRNYRLWFFGQGLSLIGTWMQTMAQQVLVYRLTGSAAALGVISAIGLIPLVPLALWGGSIADRAPKRTIIVIAQTVMMIQAFVLAALAWSGAVQVWQVYLLAFVLAAAQAVDLPARQAFTVELVEGKEDLTNAIGLNSAMFNGARALGPALAGTLVAAVGEGPAFLLNALSFVAVIISLLLMRDLPAPKGERRNASLAGHMAEGLRFIVQQRTILVLISLVAVSAFLSMPYSTLMPVFAGKVLQTSSQPVVAFLCEGPHPLMRCRAPQALPLGLLLTIVGVGALVGALAVASLPERCSSRPVADRGQPGLSSVVIGLRRLALVRGFAPSALRRRGQFCDAERVGEHAAPDHHARCRARPRDECLHADISERHAAGWAPGGFGRRHARRSAGGGHRCVVLVGVRIVCGGQIPEGEGDAVRRLCIPGLGPIPVDSGLIPLDACSDGRFRRGAGWCRLDPRHRRPQGRVYRVCRSHAGLHPLGAGLPGLLPRASGGAGATGAGCADGS